MQPHILVTTVTRFVIVIFTKYKRFETYNTKTKTILTETQLTTIKSKCIR